MPDPPQRPYLSLYMDGAMKDPAQARSGILIALTVLGLGAITTASADVHSGSSSGRGSGAPIAVLASAPGDAKPELDLSKLPPSSPEQLGLSRHLKQIGALFYGAWWCPACSRQKALFGKQAATALPYVECDRVPSDRDVCIAAEIKAFPTWVLQGKERLVGVQSLDELKRWSGYDARSGGR